MGGDHRATHEGAHVCEPDHGGMRMGSSAGCTCVSTFSSIDFSTLFIQSVSRLFDNLLKKLALETFSRDKFTVSLKGTSTKIKSKEYIYCIGNVDGIVSRLAQSSDA